MTKRKNVLLGAMVIGLSSFWTPGFAGDENMFEYFYNSFIRQERITNCQEKLLGLVGKQKPTFTELCGLMHEANSIKQSYEIDNEKSDSSFWREDFVQKMIDRWRDQLTDREWFVLTCPYFPCGIQKLTQYSTFLLEQWNRFLATDRMQRVTVSDIEDYLKSMYFYPQYCEDHAYSFNQLWYRIVEGKAIVSPEVRKYCEWWSHILGTCDIDPWREAVIKAVRESLHDGTLFEQYTDRQIRYFIYKKADAADVAILAEQCAACFTQFDEQASEKVSLCICRREYSDSFSALLIKRFEAAKKIEGAWDIPSKSYIHFTDDAVRIDWMRRNIFDFLSKRTYTYRLLVVDLLKEYQVYWTRFDRLAIECFISVFFITRVDSSDGRGCDREWYKYFKMRLEALRDATQVWDRAEGCYVDISDKAIFTHYMFHYCFTLPESSRKRFIGGVVQGDYRSKEYGQLLHYLVTYFEDRLEWNKILETLFENCQPLDLKAILKVLQKWKQPSDNQVIWMEQMSKNNAYKIAQSTEKRYWSFDHSKGRFARIDFLRNELFVNVEKPSEWEIIEQLQWMCVLIKEIREVYVATIIAEWGQQLTAREWFFLTVPIEWNVSTRMTDSPYLIGCWDDFLKSNKVQELSPKDLKDYAEIQGPYKDWTMNDLLKHKKRLDSDLVDYCERGWIVFNQSLFEKHLQSLSSGLLCTAKCKGDTPS